MRFRQAVLLALLLFPMQAAAGPLEEGEAARQRHDYQRVAMLLQPLADRGNPRAQFQIGNMYTFGEGFKRDGVEGFKWYQKAADQGYAPAEVQVGEMHRVYKGDSFPGSFTILKQHDDAIAMEWFRKAAQQGNVEAEFKIGVLYDFGHPPIPKDKTEAIKWWRKAAEHGFADAQVSLGEYYSSVSPPNYEETLKWFRMAAEQGDNRAQFQLGDMYALGKGVKQDLVQAYMWFSFNPFDQRLKELSTQMTPQQIAQAQNFAVTWRKDHAKSLPQSGPTDEAKKH